MDAGQSLGMGELIALCLPPKILHNDCFQFLLGITVVPIEIKNNGHAEYIYIFFGGGGGVGGEGNQGALWCM